VKEEGKEEGKKLCIEGRRQMIGRSCCVSILRSIGLDVVESLLGKAGCTGTAEVTRSQCKWGPELSGHSALAGYVL
jgi:hypothetical protein